VERRKLEIGDGSKDGGDIAQTGRVVFELGPRLDLEQDVARIARAIEDLRGVAGERLDERRIEQRPGAGAQALDDHVLTQIGERNRIRRDPSDASSSCYRLALEPLRRSATVPPLGDLVERTLDARGEADSPGDGAADLAARRIETHAELRSSAAKSLREDGSCSRRQALRGFRDERRLVVGRIGEIRASGGPGDSELVPEERGRLVREAGAADMEQQAGEESVAHVVFGQSVGASKSRRNDGRPDRTLGSQTEAEVGRDREAREQVGEAEPRSHRSIFPAATSTRSSLAVVPASATPILAHLDLDAFFAAVEELEDPSLRQKPLVVGGDPHGRGVVSTANYVARRFGIHSAMSSAEALRRCPQAVFLRPRHALYKEYSQAVWATVSEIVPRVERTGLDEGYLDLRSVVDDFARARTIASAVQTAIRATTSLTCSLGVGTSKVVAKIASDRRKPGGITVVPPGKEPPFLAPLAVRLLPGVGPRAEERLRQADVETIGALATLADDELRRLLPGSTGRVLRDRARGVDPRGLELDVETVSISAEDTFPRDLSDREALHTEVQRLAELVSERLRRSGVVGRTVTAKLRYADFSIRTRSTTLGAGIDDAETIGDVACDLLDRGLRDRPGALRLVGVGVSSLSSFRQLTLDG
jgi:DNA polymerase IV